MQLENLEPELMWRYYQRGYHCLMRSGLYFRQVLRPALSHIYFQRAVPLLVVYARANHGHGELPPGFGDQMEACPLSPRDLLHLDYAISLGYAEAVGNDLNVLALSPVMEWPGPGGSSGLFIAADALLRGDTLAGENGLDGFEDEFEQTDDGDTSDDDPPTPFDL